MGDETTNDAVETSVAKIIGLARDMSTSDRDAIAAAAEGAGAPEDALDVFAAIAKGMTGEERVITAIPDDDDEAKPAATLAILLANDVVRINSHWWESAWPKEAREAVHFGVDCSDIFMWGCSESEPMGYADVADLHRWWKRDDAWGTIMWCMIKRRELPQEPVAKMMRDIKGFDLDAFAAKHGLRANRYDGLTGIMADLKYKAYAAWERGEDRDPAPFDEKWWDGWKRYQAAHPDWHDAAWDAREDALLDEWRVTNGYPEDVRGAGEPIDPRTAALEIANLVESAAEARAAAAAGKDPHGIRAHEAERNGREAAALARRLEKTLADRQKA